jgi:YVTN family beta-propeller protein
MVAVIDTRTNAITAKIPVGERPWGIALTPDGKKIYTANGVSNDVFVLDAATLKVVATIPAGQGAWGVAIGPR